MTEELKQAAQQALKELGEARKIVRASQSRQLAKDWDRRATDALANLRTAIQQAEAQQPATGNTVTVQALEAIAKGDLGGLRYLESSEAMVIRMQSIAATAIKSIIHGSQGALKCTNGTQNTLPQQQKAGAVGDTKTPENGFQGPLAQGLSTKAGASQVEPFAHICIVNTKDAGPTKFFTAPSDPRAIPVYTHPAPSAPATSEPVYWEWRHLGNNQFAADFGQWSEWKRVEARSPIFTAEDELRTLRRYIADGYKYELRALYTHPAPSEPSLIEKAISSGCFGVLPVKATIPMCKAGWGASGGELTFQQIGHIYEEMYKARPLPDDAIYAAPSVPGDVVMDVISTVREQYRGSDLGKAAECICDAIDAAMLAAKERS